MESFGDDYIVHVEELVHVRKDAVNSPMVVGMAYDCPLQSSVTKMGSPTVFTTASGLCGGGRR